MTAERALTVQALRRLLSNVPDHARVGVFTDDDPQGWSVLAGQGFNIRENIFWLRASHGDTPHFWHGYQAEIPEPLRDSLGAGTALTIIADTPTTGKEAPHTHLGTVFGHELTFTYLTTWDHEPTDSEKEQAQLAQLAKEKERNDNAG
jgi:hypothetical protein